MDIIFRVLVVCCVFPILSGAFELFTLGYPVVSPTIIMTCLCIASISIVLYLVCAIFNILTSIGKGLF